MASEPAYQALFLGAGPQMRCGVGQFTRLLCETIDKLDPGCTTTLTLTRSEGSVADIWRTVGTAQNLVCNFPIVAWKRVMFRPLLALAIARLRGSRVILVQHEWFRHDRCGLQFSVGTLPHDKVMKAIELFGTVVKPAIDKALGPAAAPALASA